jgi:predicted O-methyltransferase YrrM
MARMLRTVAKACLKHAAFVTPLHRSLFNPYPFMYSPGELIFLAQCILRAEAVPGSFVEAGCAYGATTLWLSKYMEECDIDRDYYAIDTFSGFPRYSVEYEYHHRHKSDDVTQFLATNFGDNRQAWFDKTMAHHHAYRVRSIQADVSNFDWAALAPIAFCLLDVDLYLPIKIALPNIYEILSPGGILIVDDCWPDEKWDGALQAYEEFTEAKGLEQRIVGRKLGVIRR